MNRFRMFTGIIAMGCLLACGKSSTDTGDEAAVEPQPASKPASPTVDAARFRVSKLPGDMVKLDAILDHRIHLLGYTVNATDAIPGDRITVVWYWKSVKPISGSWEYFTHLLDENENQISGRNSGGTMRTLLKPEMWRPGDLLKDEETITVPADWRSPWLELRTGIWSGPQRMKVVQGPSDEDNRVRGPRIRVQTTAPSRTVSADTRSLRVEVPFSRQAPRIDGNVEGDPAWTRSVTLSPFSDTLTGSPVSRSTEVRLMWDGRFLYVAMIAEDTFLRTAFTSSHPDLWKDDAFVMLLDPGSDGNQYYEFQVNPLGVLSESHLVEYRVHRHDFESRSRVAVRVEGTVNDDLPDTGWTLEMAIPLSSLHGSGLDLSGSEPLLFGANFFRIDVGETETTQIVYSGWSPPLRGDFHAMDRFGTLVLSRQK